MPSLSLLLTKLYRPRVSADFVRRQRLHEQLDQGVEFPLSLVSAPAGYGKSTLVSAWGEATGRPCAWLSLDEADGEIGEFLMYLVAAVRTVEPEACPKTAAVLNAPSLPPMKVLAQSLVNDLDAIETPFILALDDYHRILPSSAVHDLLSSVLEHPPRPLNLVLVTRRDPPLPLAALRARGSIAEVGLQDLRFTAAEISELLEQVLAMRVSEDALVNLGRVTEGWIVGLRLVLLHLRELEDPEGFLSELRGGIQHTQEYLLLEVLAHRLPRMQDWLVKTSILDRFCSELCQAVCATEVTEPSNLEGEQFVEKLQLGGLFTIALDPQGKWLRYHHLFQELLLEQLKNRMSPDEVAALHRRASEWFESQGLIDEAFRHALDSGGVQLAVRLVERYRYDLMNTEQWLLLELWLKMLPPGSWKTNPILLSAQAYLYERRGQLIEAYGYRDQAETLLSTLPPESPEGKAVLGEILVLLSEQQILSGEVDRAIQSAEQALELLPPAARHMWSYAVGAQVLASQMSGDMGRGLDIVNEILNEPALLPGNSEARMMLWLCLAYWMEGDLNGLKQPASRCLELGEQRALPESLSFGRYFLGVFHYVRNELPEATGYLASLVDDPLTARSGYFAQGSFALALIHTAQGRDEDASKAVESAMSHFMGRHDTSAFAVAQAFQVDLTLRQGKTRVAERLSQGATFDLFPPIWFLHVPQLTPAKLLLAKGTPKSLEKALGQLDQLDGFLRKVNRKTIRIDLLALQALVLDAQGKERAAFEKLSESLALAEKGRFIRNFPDLGRPMADLLRRLLKNEPDRAFIQQVLAAFAASKLTPAQAHADLAEHLTVREEEILGLVAKRLRDKEIAKELVVSPETIKYHLKNLYQKLGVHGRRQAVVKARELYLIDPP